MESDPDVELERIVYERDLQRTRWLIKAYYRTRIRKIEAHVQHYLHHQEYTSRLSAAELEYAKDFFTCIGRCAVCKPIAYMFCAQVPAIGVSTICGMLHLAWQLVCFRAEATNTALLDGLDLLLVVL